MKKKVLTILILSIAAAVSLTACGGDLGSGNGTTPPSVSQSEAGNEPTESQEAAPSKEADQGGNMVGSGDLGDYHVEIKGASIVKDYEDKPAILVSYAWTNNSDDTTSAMVAVIGKAFQDGVELDNAMLLDVEGYDSGAFMKDVRPGTTIDVQTAFVLTSETSTVEFELSELISLSDDMVTMDFDPTAL